MSDTSNDSSPADDADLAPLTQAEQMRAALERKKAATGEHPGNAGSAGQKLKDSNSKRQRQFRRKSGG